MEKKPRTIALALKVDPVDPEHSVLPRESTEATRVRITPFRIKDEEGKETVDFRVEFEPDNRERRVQPFREEVEPKFPGGWEVGDDWKRDKKYDQ